VATFSGFSLLGQTLSDQVKQQITAVLAQKAALNAAQQKVQSGLMFGALAARGELNAQIPVPAVPLAPLTGLTTVDIKANVSADLLKFISDLGGQIVSQYPR
jgi:hypothetical protein